MGMFVGAESFNIDISSWNVSSVENMSGMFKSASQFNTNIRNWNIKNVTDMRWMFIDAQGFNQTFRWNLTHVNIDEMFESGTLGLNVNICYFIVCCTLMLFI